MRTSLIIGLFGDTGARNCAEDEHRKLLDAIKQKDGDQAAELMVEHLKHIEADLDLSSEAPGKIDVREIFR